MAHVTRCPYCGSVWLLPDARTAERGPVKCSECRHSFDATCDLLEVPDSMFPDQTQSDDLPVESFPPSAAFRNSGLVRLSPSSIEPTLQPAAQPAAEPKEAPVPDAVQPRSHGESELKQPENKPVRTEPHMSAPQAQSQPEPTATPSPAPRIAPADSRQDPSLGDIAKFHEASGLPAPRITTPSSPKAEDAPRASARRAPIRADFEGSIAHRKPDRSGTDMSIGLTLLLVVLIVAIAAVVFNQKIIKRYPDSDQLFSRICRTVPCPGYCFKDIESLAVTRSMLRSLDAEHQFLLEATLTNTASVEQTLPNLRIEFFDGAGEPLLKRTVTPEQYLESGMGKKTRSLKGGKSLTVRFTLASSVAPTRSSITPLYESPEEQAQEGAPKP